MRYISILLAVFFLGFPSSGPAKSILTGESEGMVFQVDEVVSGQGSTTLSRARLQEEKLTGWQDLLVTKSATGTSRHFGSCIAFDGSGHLFFSVGDRGVRSVKEERLLLDLDERIRDVIESPEGWLYVSTDSGRIMRIKPSSK